jgi:hypothetical protein
MLGFLPGLCPGLFLGPPLGAPEFEGRMPREPCAANGARRPTRSRASARLPDAAAAPRLEALLRVLGECGVVAISTSLNRLPNENATHGKIAIKELSLHATNHIASLRQPQ